MNSLRSRFFSALHENRRCDKCVYWSPSQKGDKEGDCHRYPPHPLMIGVVTGVVVGLQKTNQAVINYFYSRTQGYHNCGEFKPDRIRKVEAERETKGETERWAPTAGGETKGGDANEMHLRRKK